MSTATVTPVSRPSPTGRAPYQDISMPLGGFIALDWVLLMFGGGFVALRLYIRRKRPTLHGTTTAQTVSDILVVAAWLAGGVLVAINTWKNSLRMKYLHWPKDKLYYGVPRHMAAHLLMVSWVSLFFIYISLWLSKAAFIAFYYHLYERLGPWCRFVKWFVAIFTFSTFLLHMFLLAFWCEPTSLNWDINGNLCSAVHNMESVTISTFTNIGTDILIVLLPLVVLRHLTFQRAQVLVYVFVISIGSLSIVAALVRWGALKAIWPYIGVEGTTVTHTIDVWAMVEIVTSLIAVCGPALRVFIRNTKSPGNSDNVPRTKGDNSYGYKRPGSDKSNMTLYPLDTTFSTYTVRGSEDRGQQPRSPVPAATAPYHAA